jgi:hypothetical protein
MTDTTQADDTPSPPGAGTDLEAARSKGPDLRKVAGWSAVAFVVLALAQFPLYMQGDNGVSLYDGRGMALSASHIHNVIFTRILLDLGVYAAGMVFAAALSQLIRLSSPAAAWIGSLLVASMAVWVGVALVANSLEGGTALDTLSGRADPSAQRALLDGYLLIYNGSIAFAITALFLATAGYASVTTRVLPRWTGWIAYAGAALCLASIPAMYGGAADPQGFYNPGGWGPVIVANFPCAIWFILAAGYLLKPKHLTPAR